MKTAQETGETVEIIGKWGEIGGKFWGNSGKIGEFREKVGGNSGKILGKLVNFGGIRGKFWGNWGKIGQLCFHNGETEFTDCEINSPTSGKKGENEGNLFHKKSPQV